MSDETTDTAANDQQAASEAPDDDDTPLAKSDEAPEGEPAKDDDQ